MSTEGVAHGKVILFGEHAVVYGIPAIAVGIDRGARAKAVALESGPSTLRVADWNLCVREDDPETPLARAFGDLLRVTRDAGVAVSAVSVEAAADLPPGAGAWEAVFHGNASGVDAAVASLGGCVLFERGAPVGSTITRIRAPGVVHLCIGNSGQASSTRSMVESVARLRERRPETTQKAFDAIHTLVKNARLAIEAADRRAVGQLLDLNQMLLSGLFVSTPDIEQMCSTARAAGALGAKLTGAGGGGCVVALVDHPEVGAKVLSAWKSDGFDGFLTSFGAPDLGRRTSTLMESAP